MKRPVRNLRWIIAGLLFLSTVINYIDRQTLSVLGPMLKQEHHWSNADFAWIIISFRVAYSIGQTVAGRFLDRMGTRNGLSITVLWYSVAAMATSLATGLRSFCAFRFLLGAGEAANWPGATKAVSEWFPRRESGWAVALFDSGSSIGAALAPMIVLGAYKYFGRVEPVFVLTGMLGLVWLVFFRAVYHAPESHPRISPEELAMLKADRAEGASFGAASGRDARAGDPAAGSRYSIIRLLSFRQTWGYIISKALTDPVWFFVSDWFPILLLTKGYKLEDSLVAYWALFLAADAGNFFGGGVSSWLIKRGYGVGAARKAIAVVGGVGMALIIPAAFADSLITMIVLFAGGTFSYAAFSTVILNLPADLYPPHSVASASGLGGTAAGMVTIVATYAIGQVSDKYSFTPILMGAGTIALVGMAAFLLLVRNTSATSEGLLRRV